MPKHPMLLGFPIRNLEKENVLEPENKNSWTKQKGPPSRRGLILKGYFCKNLQ